MSVDNSSLLNTLVINNILKKVNMNSKNDIVPYVIFILLWSDKAICLGCKKSNHNRVNQYFNNELHQLGQPVVRYVSKFKQSVPTVVRLVAYLADRPEHNILEISVFPTISKAEAKE